MQCEAARLLIEAFHDDELGVADAAVLLGHVEVCPDCAERHEATARLRQVISERHPLDHCPEDVRTRLARCARRGWRSPTGVGRWVVLALAGGVGFVAGGFLPWRSGWSAGAEPSSFPPPAASEVRGEVFCLRCAMSKLFPNASFARTAHEVMLRTDDGRLFKLIRSDVVARQLAAEGCTGRHVVVSARLFPREGLADVLTVKDR